jgi:ribulose-5-phosphate 4-epimerase/fuculose-1-phosphate aldolase
MSKWDEAKRQVLEAARQMLREGLVVATSGNISLRLPPEGGRELLAITPSSRYYDTMTADDIQVIDFETEPVEGDLPPSTETKMHVGIYRARPEVNAVMHSHPVYASVISVTGWDIPPILEDQAVFIGGEIKLAPYAPSGSDEMVANLIGALGERNAALLPNHGAVAVGRTMREALTISELLEKTAKIYYLALLSGKVNQLPDEALRAGLAYFRRLQGRAE